MVIVSCAGCIGLKRPGARYGGASAVRRRASASCRGGGGGGDGFWGGEGPRDEDDEEEHLPDHAPEDEDDDDDDEARAAKAAQRWTQRAFEAAHEGRSSAAASAFKRALRLTPEDAPYRAALLINAGSYLAFSGRSNDALAPLKEAASLAILDAPPPPYEFAEAAPVAWDAATGPPKPQVPGALTFIGGVKAERAGEVVDVTSPIVDAATGKTDWSKNPLPASADRKDPWTAEAVAAAVARALRTCQTPTASAISISGSRMIAVRRRRSDIDVMAASAPANSPARDAP